MEEQMDIFDFIKEPFKIDKPIRLIELFAGIGAQAKALERLNVDFEHYRVVEFDKYAIASYNAIHGTSFEAFDIRDVHAADLGINEIDKYTYIMTYSFPCQDLSISGKQRGMSKEAKTRSGLLWQVERILNECDELPQVLMMENVNQVHGKKNIIHFKKWMVALENLGYENYWYDLNAKDFGIPQNRDRCFMVSVRKGYSYKFPKCNENSIDLSELLESEVKEDYFISDELYDVLIHKSEMKSDAIKIVNCTKKGYLEARLGDGVSLDFPKSNVRRGRVQTHMSSTLCTSCNQGVVVVRGNRLDIRRLTPLECWRLMGFDDQDFYKAKAVNSDSQLYKQAGNSIVVNVLVAIFKEMI